MGASAAGGGRRRCCIASTLLVVERAPSHAVPASPVGEATASSALFTPPFEMPTYEYACPACGIVEAFQSIKEDALTKCPMCKKRKVTRMVSGGGAVIFKGSGFWETDYNRSQEYTKKSKEDAPKAAEPPAQAQPKPQTQAAAKPAPAPASTPSTEPPSAPPAKT
jgi:putative FmdB family regulatory protein